MCARTAGEHAVEFRAADRPQRLAMLAADCREWFARNGWRFSRRVTGNDAAWQAIIRSRCAAEAGEDLERLAGMLAREPPAVARAPLPSPARGPGLAEQEPPR